MRTQSATVSDTGLGAARGQRGAERVGVVGVAEQVDAEVGADGARRDPVDRDDGVRVLGRTQVADPGHRLGLGAQQGEQPPLEGALVQLHRVADAEAAHHVEELLEGDALGVQEDLVSGIEDADVTEHLALGGEKGGVAAASGRQRLDVV